MLMRAATHLHLAGCDQILMLLALGSRQAKQFYGRLEHAERVDLVERRAAWVLDAATRRRSTVDAALAAQTG
jgi:hypothetical protein